ncbi:MAG: hypothetical protein P1V97_37090 [Planctomycetota bacterium]|nr:hypothetical protein [Planctomycetota bacterium]
MIQTFVKRTANSPLDSSESHWRKFCFFILIVVVCHHSLYYTVPTTLIQSLHQDIFGYGVFLLTILAFFVPRFLRGVLIIVCLNVGMKLFLIFPSWANHEFLEFLLLFGLAFSDHSQLEDRTNCLCFARWLAVIVFFSSGVQKLLYQSYFRGSFLGVTIARGGKLSDFFQYLLTKEEFERLLSLGGVEGTGPYAIDSSLFLVLSNFVYLSEIGLAILLLIPGKARLIGVWGSVFLILGIELGAREIVFGCLILFLVIQFSSEKINRISYPILLSILIGGVTLAKIFPSWELN